MNQIFKPITFTAADDIMQQLRSLLPDRLNPLSNFASVEELIFALFTWAYYFAGLIMIAYLIFGGYKYITSGGNEEKIKEGQKSITNAIIGFVIVLAAATILETLKLVLEIEQ
ncbi:MAG: pilin [Patescibacteria group bacterium]